MIIYYRVSNNSYNKPKLDNVSKESCLKNALKHFIEYVELFHIVADNVTDEKLIEYLEQINKEYSNVTLEYTQLNNAASFRYILSKALTLDDEKFVYFLEDDYIHKNNSYKVLKEGLDLGHYATLYDHSDMYKNHSEGGDNPFIEGGGEDTKVLLTESSHWKLTISTTMTFATTVNILKEDLDIWNFHIQGNHPHDFYAFVDLRKKDRSLVVPIPGYSTHACVGYLSPLYDWNEELLK
jgi:hypothetical protein